MNLSEIITPARCITNAQGRSKKRLFEFIASTIEELVPDLSTNIVFDALIARERLGPTGLGEGVAVPHCRLPEPFVGPIALVISLEQAISFDAPDDKPVDLLVVLLVSEQATQEHLDLLAAIASRLKEAKQRTSLREASDADELYRAFTEEI